MYQNKLLNTKRKAWLLTRGLPATDYQEWRRKWKGLKSRATQQGLVCNLTFQDYVRLATKAGVTQPSMIGKQLHLYQMGRVGDAGDYVKGNCRFITMQQNLDERVTNGGARRCGDKRKGLTKHNDASVESMANLLRGRNKDNHAGVAAGALARSRKFRLVDPLGKVYLGQNLKEFCRQHGLEFTGMSRTLNGKKPHYKRWTGGYLS